MNAEFYGGLAVYGLMVIGMVYVRILVWSISKKRERNRVEESN